MSAAAEISGDEGAINQPEGDDEEPDRAKMKSNLKRLRIKACIACARLTLTFLR